MGSFELLKGSQDRGRLFQRALEDLELQPFIVGSDRSLGVVGIAERQLARGSSGK